MEPVDLDLRPDMGYEAASLALPVGHVDDRDVPCAVGIRADWAPLLAACEMPLSTAACTCADLDQSTLYADL
jgi:hypothetical protein